MECRLRDGGPPVTFIARVLAIASLAVTIGALGPLACAASDPSSEGSWADLSAGAGDRCIAREGEICGTPAKIGCAAGLLCSTSVPLDDGACIRPGAAPPATPAKPHCTPVRTPGGLCATAAGLTCAPDLECTFGFADDTGARPATGSCRLKVGGKCTFAKRRLCGESMVCDFDPATDPEGEHGICHNGRRCDDEGGGFGVCPEGMSCDIVIDSFADTTLDLITACQILPFAKQGEHCGGGADAICVPGLVCTKHLNLPSHSGTCDPPKDGGNGHFGLDGTDLLH
jgi:hypothetical protein